MKDALEQRNNLSIIGVDPSDVMVYQALRRLNKRLINGQIRLIEGIAESMPALPQKADKVIVINNVPFRESPVETLKHIRREMNDGVKIALMID